MEGFSVTYRCPDFQAEVVCHLDPNEVINGPEWMSYSYESLLGLLADQVEAPEIIITNLRSGTRRRVWPTPTTPEEERRQRRRECRHRQVATKSMRENRSIHFEEAERLVESNEFISPCRCKACNSH